MRQFTINDEEQKVINDWLESLKPEIMAIQRKSYEAQGELEYYNTHLSLDGKYPYYGACGGGITYKFIPTSLGTILVVEETITKKELNVTDALGWKDW